jgi:hypothetical protein
MLNDGTGHTLPPPGGSHNDGSQFPGAILVRFDLAAADDLAILIHYHNEPPPIYP